MIKAFSTRKLQDAISGFVIELNDGITNEVRKYLDKLAYDELIEVKKYLNKLLNICYNGILYNDEITIEEVHIFNLLNEKQKFLFKQTIIYFLGRLPIEIDLKILKQAYSNEDDIHTKLNIVCSTLSSFDEELELDFVDKLLNDKEYDKMLRSWTMAFFKKVDNPYEYEDNPYDDCTPAKLPRLKRLAINDEDNPKYNKAMAFRLLDLTTIYLFIRSRNNKELSKNEKEIIKNTNIDFKSYSTKKKKMMNNLIQMICMDRG
jgi:hypothetical protein